MDEKIIVRSVGKGLGHGGKVWGGGSSGSGIASQQIARRGGSCRGRGSSTGLLSLDNPVVEIVRAEALACKDIAKDLPQIGIIRTFVKLQGSYIVKVELEFEREAST